MSVSEHDEQVRVIQWFEAHYRDLYPLLMAYPSGFVAGGKNKFGLINKMKKEGWRKGVPDLFLALPSVDCGGLWIEMKAEKGKASQEQLEYLERLSGVGYEAHLCKGADAAIHVISEYMVRYKQKLKELRE